MKVPLVFVKLNGVTMQFMADLGSPITILRDSTFLDEWGHKIELMPTDINLKAIGEKEIEMIGYFQVDIECLSRSANSKVYVAIKGKKIIGWKDLAKMGLYLVPGSENHIRVAIGCCDGSDRSDPHTIAPSVTSAWDDPEATQRAALPNGAALYPRDARDVKGEVLVFQRSAVGRNGDFQEAAAERTRRLETIQEERSLRPSGIPEDRPRLEHRILTVPSRAEDSRPREADA
ncbi:hypothetical protein NDU88_005176 [Pleurodeles waltl]|uniref:Peptidase A2 domain-containing protein n=1 Tax=Pleurodeles waltl TaxID=8319 RepID=A0AAV7RIX7_PLEWA|nr:hypothetical protein NDU88_005176 [Pleurodeles waltl]